MSSASYLLPVICLETGKAYEGSKNYYRRERHYSAFERPIPLPVAVQAEKATADLKNGALAVTLPTREPAKVQQIPIKAS